MVAAFLARVSHPWNLAHCCLDLDCGELSNGATVFWSCRVRLVKDQVRRHLELLTAGAR